MSNPIPVSPVAPRPKANTAKEEERIHCLVTRSVEVLSAWNFKGLSLPVWLPELESLSAAEPGLVSESEAVPAGSPVFAELVAGSGRVGKAFAGGCGSWARLSEPPVRDKLVPTRCELACSREEEDRLGFRAAPLCPLKGFEVGLVPGFEVPP